MNLHGTLEIATKRDSLVNLYKWNPRDMNTICQIPVLRIYLSCKLGDYASLENFRSVKSEIMITMPGIVASESLQWPHLALGSIAQ